MSLVSGGGDGIGAGAVGDQRVRVDVDGNVYMCILVVDDGSENKTEGRMRVGQSGRQRREGRGREEEMKGRKRREGR